MTRDQISQLIYKAIVCITNQSFVNIQAKMQNNDLGVIINGKKASNTMFGMFSRATTAFGLFIHELHYDRKIISESLNA